MTEQSEQMLRLIRNGKIVEYLHIKDGSIIFMETLREDSFNCNLMNSSDLLGFYQNLGNNFYTFDSFNPSFKFGDKWIFEGDKVKLTLSDSGGGDEYIGKIMYEDFTFKFLDDKDIYSYALHKYISEDYETDITVIGNIYENEASHG